MLEQLKSNIYISDYDSSNDRPRLAYIKGSRLSVMIDAGNSPAHFNQFIHDCDQYHLKSPDFIILTHWHWDHVYGLSGTTIPAISSKLTQDKLIEMSHWKWDDESMKNRLLTGEDIEFCDTNIRIEYSNPFDIKVRNADILFEKELIINLGALTCVCYQVDNDHSPDSVVIYIPEEKVLFLGDIISPNYHHGNEHYTQMKFNNLIEELFKIDFELAVHGHTEVFTRETLRLFFQNPEAHIKESNE